MKRFPPSSFYHWADPANLPSIRQYGLLSTERLLGSLASGTAITAAFRPPSRMVRRGWPVIEGQRRSRSVMPAEIVLEGHLPLEPFLTGMR
jgi:hypothetical protein